MSLFYLDYFHWITLPFHESPVKVQGSEEPSLKILLSVMLQRANCRPISISRRFEIGHRSSHNINILVVNKVHYFAMT